MTTKLSTAGRALIKTFEGLSLTAYPDGQDAQHRPMYSIGYGHNGVAKGTVITKAEADRLFELDAVKYETAVASVCPISLPHEFDAMVSLSYNIGTEGFKRSTVARRHASGDTTGAADAFLMWDKETKNGVLVTSAVLGPRREKERTIYLHGYGGAPPGETVARTTYQSNPTGSGGWGLRAAGAVLAVLGVVLIQPLLPAGVRMPARFTTPIEKGLTMAKKKISGWATLFPLAILGVVSLGWLIVKGKGVA